MMRNAIWVLFLMFGLFGTAEAQTSIITVCRAPEGQSLTSARLGDALSWQKDGIAAGSFTFTRRKGRTQDEFDILSLDATQVLYSVSEDAAILAITDTPPVLTLLADYGNTAGVVELWTLRLDAFGNGILIYSLHRPDPTLLPARYSLWRAECSKVVK